MQQMMAVNIPESAETDDVSSANGGILMPGGSASGFDFCKIQDEGVREQVRHETFTIRATTSHAFMVVGCCLARIRDLLEGTGLFTNFVQEEFGFTWRTASRYINGFTILSAHQISPQQIDAAGLGKNTIHMLSRPSAPKEVVESIMEKIRIGDRVSSAEVAAALAGVEERSREEIETLKDEKRELARRAEKEQARANQLELDGIKKREQLDRASQKLEAAHTEVNELTNTIDDLVNKLAQEKKKSEEEVMVAVETKEVEVLPKGFATLQEAILELEAKKQRVVVEVLQIQNEIKEKKDELVSIEERIKSVAIYDAELSDLEQRLSQLVADYPLPSIEDIAREADAEARLRAIANEARHFADRIQAILP